MTTVSCVVQLLGHSDVMVCDRLCHENKLFLLQLCLTFNLPSWLDSSFWLGLAWYITFAAGVGASCAVTGTAVGVPL